MVERAAIHEYLAGMSRQEAEAEASGGEVYTASPSDMSRAS